MSSIPESHRDLLERPILVSLATVQPDGQPQVTPVWADLHDGQVRINTAAGRQKHKNLLDRKQATVMAVDPDNDQRYIEIRGEVTDVSEATGNDVIDQLARDYLGTDSYPYYVEGEQRVTFLIRPTRVLVSN
jgi:PPOX class probable F420-dependent enzyme